MKKLMSYMLMAAILLTFANINAEEAAIHVDCKYDASCSLVTIDAEIYPAKENVGISVMVKEEDGSINFLEQGYTDDRGMIEFQYSNIQIGAYDTLNTVYIKRMDTGETDSGTTFVKHSDQTATELIAQLSRLAASNDAEGIKALLQSAEELSVIGVTLSDFDTLNVVADDVGKTLINYDISENDTVADVKKMVMGAAIASSVNKNKSAKELENILLNWQLSAIVFGEHECFLKLSDSVKQLGITEAVKNGDFKTAREIGDALERLGLIFELKCGNSLEDSIRLIMEYRDAGHLNENQSNKFLQQTLSIQTKAISFISEALINTMAYSEIDGVIVNGVTKATQNVTTNSGDGGGGSNGGKSTGVIGTVTDTSLTDKITQNIADSLSSYSYFDDLSDVVWAKEAIEGLAKRDIISGMGENKYEPNRNVTCEEWAKIAVNAFEINNEGVIPSFQDVSTDSWSYPYVKRAYAAGIMMGETPNFLNAKGFVTRERAVTVIARILIEKGFEMTVATERFSDENEISAWAMESVGQLRNAKIIKGKDDTHFCPKDNISRAEAAKMIYDALVYAKLN